jgi:hypothetical protein
MPGGPVAPAPRARPHRSTISRARAHSRVRRAVLRSAPAAAVEALRAASVGAGEGRGTLGAVEAVLARYSWQASRPCWPRGRGDVLYLHGQSLVGSLREPDKTKLRRVWVELF